MNKLDQYTNINGYNVKYNNRTISKRIEHDIRTNKKANIIMYDIEIPTDSDLCSKVKEYERILNKDPNWSIIQNVKISKFREFRERHNNFKIRSDEYCILYDGFLTYKHIDKQMMIEIEYKCICNHKWHPKSNGKPFYYDISICVKFNLRPEYHCEMIEYNETTSELCAKLYIHSTDENSSIEFYTDDYFEYTSKCNNSGYNNIILKGGEFKRGYSFIDYDIPKYGICMNQITSSSLKQLERISIFTDDGRFRVFKFNISKIDEMSHFEQLDFVQLKEAIKLLEFKTNASNDCYKHGSSIYTSGKLFTYIPLIRESYKLDSEAYDTKVDRKISKLALITRKRISKAFKNGCWSD